MAESVGAADAEEDEELDIDEGVLDTDNNSEEAEAAMFDATALGSTELEGLALDADEAVPSKTLTLAPVGAGEGDADAASTTAEEDVAITVMVVVTVVVESDEFVLELVTLTEEELKFGLVALADEEEFEVKEFEPTLVELNMVEFKPSPSISNSFARGLNTIVTGSVLWLDSA